MKTKKKKIVHGSSGGLATLKKHGLKQFSKIANMRWHPKVKRK